MDSYTLRFCGQEVEVGLAWRENGTGSDLWDSALVLAGYFECCPAFAPLEVGGSNKSFWAGKRVVELGSGTGALGLLIAKLRAAHVVLTDLPECCPLLRKNARANGCIAIAEDRDSLDTAASASSSRRRNSGDKSSSQPHSNSDKASSNSDVSDGSSTSASNNNDAGVAHVVPLFWGEPLPTVLSQEPIDLVIGTDLLLPFAPELFGPLCRSIAALLAVGRDKTPLASQSCSSNGFPDEVHDGIPETSASSSTRTNSTDFHKPCALLAYEERFDVSDFFKQCTLAGLDVLPVDLGDLHPTYRDPGKIHVMRLVLQ